MSSGPRPRRPSKVIVLVLGCWVIGLTLQNLFGSLAATSGMVDPGIATLIGRVLAWGLLFVIAFIYREQIDVWLRT
jgi:hypothetical protein